MEDEEGAHTYKDDIDDNCPMTGDDDTDHIVDDLIATQLSDTETGSMSMAAGIRRDLKVRGEGDIAGSRPPFLYHHCEKLHREMGQRLDPCPIFARLTNICLVRFNPIMINNLDWAEYFFS